MVCFAFDYFIVYILYISNVVNGFERNQLWLGKIKPENLQKIAEGHEPSKPDIYRIASFLHVEARELLALRDRTFKSKRKEPNGAH